MADRVSASITIGGIVSRHLRTAFVKTIQDEGPSTEWDGAPFDAEQLPYDAPLMLFAHEVAWGRLNRLEAFCIAHHLPFVRWSGACPGSFEAERMVFTGSGEPQSFAASDEDYVVIGRYTAQALGSYEAIIAHFDAADFAVPPLGLVT